MGFSQFLAKIEKSKMTQPRFFLIAALAVFLIVALENQQVLSACCNALSSGNCNDNTVSTPCCGIGSCNIFCCACKNGCRMAPPLRQFQRSVELGAQETDQFERFDVNKDGHHDIYESYNMFGRSGCGGNFTGTVNDYKLIFNEFDKDGNGKLNWSEIIEIH